MMQDNTVKKILWLLMTLLMFFIFFYLLAQGLKRDQQQMPSAYIDKPLPDFNLPSLFDPVMIYDKSTVLGQVALINVWASWCPPCAAEHEVIKIVAEYVPVFGLNYQDDLVAAQTWLKDLGNPYTAVFYDESGKTGIDWGVIAVPETFLIDAQGIVRYRHIGGLTLEVWNEKFVPLINQLNQSYVQ